MNQNLIVLAPDKNIQYGLKGLLSRSTALGIGPIVFEIYVHPHRDPGCFLRSEEFMRQFHKSYAFALVVFDRVGCGREDLSREEIEKLTEARLFASGWAGR